MAVVQVQKACKASGNWATWIGGGIGILEVLAPHLGEPRLVLETSGLELVCVLILWQILQTNSQAENVNIAVAHRQPSSLNLTMVPLQQQRVWQHQEGGGRGLFTPDKWSSMVIGGQLCKQLHGIRSDLLQCNNLSMIQHYGQQRSLRDKWLSSTWPHPLHPSLSISGFFFKGFVK
jgi:hypothetical protein